MRAATPTVGAGLVPALMESTHARGNACEFAPALMNPDSLHGSDSYNAYNASVTSISGPKATAIFGFATTWYFSV